MFNYTNINVGSFMKSFWLDKATGKKCYMLGGREVSISLENVTSYWRWMPQPSSRFVF